MRRDVSTAAPGTPPNLAPLAGCAHEAAQALVLLASDLALVVDADGVIRHVAQAPAVAAAAGDHAAPPAAIDVQHWPGRRWADMASHDTRGKIDALCQEAATQRRSRRREVNHPPSAAATAAGAAAGADNPDTPDTLIAYTAVRLGDDGPLLVAGQDLRALAAQQQRVVEAQQALEHAYWQARQPLRPPDTSPAGAAALQVDATSFEIIGANAAAALLLGVALPLLPGRHAGFGIAHGSRAAVNALLAATRDTGDDASCRVRLKRLPTGVLAALVPSVSAAAGRAASVHASVLSGPTGTTLLVCLVPDGVPRTPGAPAPRPA